MRRSCRRLSSQFRDACFNDGDSDYVSASSVCGDDFMSLQNSPLHICYADSDSECQSSPGREGRRWSIDNLYNFSNRLRDRLDSEDDDDEGAFSDINDQYEFDPAKVAALLKQRPGVTLEELTDEIGKAMEEATVAKLANVPAFAASPIDMAEPSPMMAGDLSGRMTPPSMSGDLSGRMTPLDLAGRMTPPHAAQPLVTEAEITNALTKHMAGASAGKRRRSSLAHCRRLSVAVDDACKKHRESLVTAASQELSILGSEADVAQEVPEDIWRVQRQKEKEIQRCMEASHRQRRQSLLKAAEVLQEAGVGEDSKVDLSEEEVTAQLQLVQKAVEGARKRHRQSIRLAVSNVAKDRDQVETASGSSRTQVRSGPSRERLEQAIAAMLAKNENEASRKDAAPRKQNQTPAFMALMRTRASVAGRRVHCGPTPTKALARKAPTQKPAKARGGA